ncbi:MAG: 4Fe-4S binding protein [Eubacterium sp.]|nr:4Fe-4S binding protein [Eubacterium sp.]
MIDNYRCIGCGKCEK